MKYTVTIARTEYRYHEFEVEADSIDNAEYMAKQLAEKNTDWKLVDVDQFVNNIQPSKE